MLKDRGETDRLLGKVQDVLAMTRDAYNRAEREPNIYPVLRRAAARLSNETRAQIVASSSQKTKWEAGTDGNRVDGQYLVSCFSDTFGHVLSYGVYSPQKEAGRLGESFRKAFMAAYALKTSVDNYNFIARPVVQNGRDLLGADFTKAAEEIEGYTKDAMRAWGVSEAGIADAQQSAIEAMNRSDSVSFIGPFEKN